MDLPVKKAVMDVDEGPRSVSACSSLFRKLMLQIMLLCRCLQGSYVLLFFSFLFVDARLESAKVKLYFSCILQENKKRQAEEISSENEKQQVETSACKYMK